MFTQIKRPSLQYDLYKDNHAEILIGGNFNYVVNFSQWINEKLLIQTDISLYLKQLKALEIPEMLEILALFYKYLLFGSNKYFLINEILPSLSSNKDRDHASYYDQQ